MRITFANRGPPAWRGLRALRDDGGYRVLGIYYQLQVTHFKPRQLTTLLARPTQHSPYLWFCTCSNTKGLWKTAKGQVGPFGPGIRAVLIRVWTDEVFRTFL